MLKYFKGDTRCHSPLLHLISALGAPPQAPPDNLLQFIMLMMKSWKFYWCVRGEKINQL